MLRNLTILCVIFAVCLGCSDEHRDSSAVAEDTGTAMADVADSGQAVDTTVGEPDTSVDEDSGGGEDSGQGDVALDTEEPDAEVCDVESCPEGERLLGCVCLPDYDRACLSDADCRQGEMCRLEEGVRLCWFEPPPVRVCPGADGCADGEGDGVLYAAGASRVITPDGFETAAPEGLDGAQINFVPDNPENLEGNWLDCGFDGLCPSDPGYPGPDEGESDQVMQGLWIAGFSSGRPAQHCPEALIGCPMVECCISKWAHDDIKAQAVVFRQGDTSVAMATVDTIGIFRGDVEAIRARVREQADIDLIVVTALHNHEAPDTAGQWGPGDPLPVFSGRSDFFIEKMVNETAAAIVEAWENLEPAKATATILDVGVEGLAVNDSRTPYIFDDNVPVVRFTAEDDGATLATVLSFALHPEVLWSGNIYLTADYPGYVRHYIEQGLPSVEDVNTGEIKPELPGLGGVTVLFAGALGGLIYPGPGGAIDYAGNPYDAHEWVTADAVGQNLASRVLGAVHNDQLDTLETTNIRFAQRLYMTEIENSIFQLAAIAGLLSRKIYNTTGTPLNSKPGLPQVLTEAAVVGLGPVTFFTAPGEMFPEVLTGGYPNRARVQNPVVGDVLTKRVAATCDEQGLPTLDGEGTFPCIIRPDAENPPDWDAAPTEPPVYAWMPGDYPFYIGLGSDFLGYMVPPFDFDTTYFSSAPGDHYEETNSVGPTSLVDWQRAVREALDALPAE